MNATHATYLHSKTCLLLSNSQADYLVESNNVIYGKLPARKMSREVIERILPT